MTDDLVTRLDALLAEGALTADEFKLLAELRDRFTAAEAERDAAAALLRAEPSALMDDEERRHWRADRDAFLARLRDRST